MYIFCRHVAYMYVYMLEYVHVCVRVCVLLIWCYLDSIADYYT